MRKFKHHGDCSIYALNCDICDCGEFRKFMPGMDKEDSETFDLLLKHQCQVRDMAYDDEINDY